VSRDVLDRQVWDSLVDLVSDPGNIRDQLAKRLHSYSARTGPTQGEVHANQEALERLSTEEERLVDAYRAQVISLDQLKAQLKKVDDTRTHLNDEKHRLQAHQESLGHPEITVRDLGDVSARLKRAMTRTDFQTRQRIVQALVNSVTLYPHRAVVSGVLPLNGNIPNDTRLLRSPFPRTRTEAD
jgi:myosin heavy subunit